MNKQNPIKTEQGEANSKPNCLLVLLVTILFWVSIWAFFDWKGVLVTVVIISFAGFLFGVSELVRKP